MIRYLQSSLQAGEMILKPQYAKAHIHVQYVPVYNYICELCMKMYNSTYTADKYILLICTSLRALICSTRIKASFFLLTIIFAKSQSLHSRRAYVKETRLKKKN